MSAGMRAVERVARGAAFLDEYAPGWRAWIDPDTDVMALTDWETCVYGQAVEGLDEPPTFGDDGAIYPGHAWAVEHGFDYDMADITDEDVSAPDWEGAWSELWYAWEVEVWGRAAYGSWLQGATGAES